MIDHNINPTFVYYVIMTAIESMIMSLKKKFFRECIIVIYEIEHSYDAYYKVVNIS